MSEQTLSVPKKQAEARKTVIQINLPPHSSVIRIDGRDYYHGFKYEVPETAVPTFNDIMAQAWKHEEEVRGARKPFDMRHRSHTLSAR